MTDRRAWDPFAPAPRHSRPAAPVVVEAKPQPADDDLDDMKKAPLVELARSRGLDTTGTRADLIARIRGDR